MDYGYGVFVRLLYTAHTGGIPPYFRLLSLLYRAAYEHGGRRHLCHGSCFCLDMRLVGSGQSRHDIRGGDSRGNGHEAGLGPRRSLGDRIGCMVNLPATVKSEFSMLHEILRV